MKNTCIHFLLAVVGLCLLGAVLGELPRLHSSIFRGGCSTCILLLLLLLSKSVISPQDEKVPSDSSLLGVGVGCGLDMTANAQVSSSSAGLHS